MGPLGARSRTWQTGPSEAILNPVMRIAALLLALSLLAGCGVPLPPEKSEYAGTWKGDNMHLAIYPAGRVSYKRKKGSHTTKIDVPIKSFDGNNIVAGIWKFETTFIVQRAPQEDKGGWTMTVDGVPLRRTSKTPQKAPD